MNDLLNKLNEMSQLVREIDVLTGQQEKNIFDDLIMKADEFSVMCRNIRDSFYKKSDDNHYEPKTDYIFFGCERNNYI